MTLKIKLFNIFVCIMLIGMMIADLFSLVGIPLVDNIDEILGIVAWIGIIIYIISRLMIPIKIFKILVLLFAFLSVGFWGNLVSEISMNAKLILMDAFLFSKPYIIFLFMAIFLTQDSATEILKFMRIIAKIMLWLLTFFAILSRYINSPMRLSSGIFVFYANYSGTVSWWTILFLSIIWATRKTEKEVINYMFLGAIVIFFNRSGLGMISFGLGIILFIFVEKKKKIRWYLIAAGAILCIVLGRNEISEYLFNDNAPRALLLKYAFVTANTYFPFGAGFATYGSSSAIREYSPLYYKYGFNHVYGMGEIYHPYLMDNYYQQIIGQLGYIGIILLLWFMYKIVKKILEIKVPNVRNAALLLYSCLIFAGIGFGTASSWGCSIYILVASFFLLGRTPTKQGD